MFEHIEVSGVFNCGKSLLNGLQDLSADVLLLDLHLPDTAGAELAASVLRLYPDMKIIILTGLESPHLIREMMDLGCMGYLLKLTTDSAMLAAAIGKVFNGGLYLEESIKDRLLGKIFTPSNKLTTREKEILQLIADGLSNAQIASRLFLSMRTVENHRYNLLQKLEVKNAVGLIRAATTMGLI
jgi:DNA-binding NarL/FixJ family response regulator